MNIWRSLTVSEYGGLQRAWGEDVVDTGGCWWRQVRPCFYRPVFPLQEVDPNSGALPILSPVGGAQYLVPTGCTSNSSLTFLIFPEAQRYSIGSLAKARRYDVRLASRCFEVRRPESADEFVVKGHAAYCSIFQRTRYSFRSDRVNVARFRAWAETFYGNSGIDVWCAYQGQDIKAVFVGVWVGARLVYSIFFASAQALKLGVSDLMLHSLRQEAARQPGITSIQAAKSGMDRGLDQFYLLRGATPVSYPAWLQINPVAALLLRLAAPGIYARTGASDNDNTEMSDPRGSSRCDGM